MSDLSAIEKRKLERALGMGSGYVLNFSNRTFEEFFLDGFGVSIYDSMYDYGSGSKANRMRAFWERESNYQVGMVLELLFTEWSEFRAPNDPEVPPVECWPIIRRLKNSTPVPDIGVIRANRKEPAFEALAKAVREGIEKNQPQGGLDRLHTFVVKYLRTLCEKREISTAKDKPLHSLLGEYIKALQKAGLIESQMTERILKSAISTFEAFNHVRNDSSFAHDNEVLNYDESILIYSNVTSAIRFIESVERRGEPKAPASEWGTGDFPF